MSSLLVQAYYNSQWNTLGATQASINRKIATSTATFLIPVATVPDRLNLRQGVEVRITMNVGAASVRFAGFVHKPHVKAQKSPRKFGLGVQCVGLEYGGTLRMINNRTYPDVIETPQNQTFYTTSGNDTYVSQLYPTTNYGSAAYMRVYGTAGMRNRSLVQFDLSAIPAYSRIESAKLRLYQENPASGLVDIGAHGIEASWTEGTVTWNTQPSYEAGPVDITTVTPDPGWAEWDVKKLVQRWVNGTFDNNGIALIRLNELEGVKPLKTFTTKEGSGNTPQLVVHWVPPVRYTDAITDLWAYAWPEINRTKVVTDTKTFSAKEEFKYVNLTQATNRLLEFLDEYVWWIEWDGSAYYLRLEPKGETPTGKTIDADDIGAEFDIEPSNADVRNFAYVLGGQMDGTESILGYYFDVNSYGKFGWRTAPAIRDGKIVDANRATDRAMREVKEKAWEYYELTVSIWDFALNPGDKVTLYLPVVGIDGVNFSDQYVVTETVDRYARGKVDRVVTFREIGGSP